MAYLAYKRRTGQIKAKKGIIILIPLLALGISGSAEGRPAQEAGEQIAPIQKPKSWQVVHIPLIKNDQENQEILDGQTSQDKSRLQNQRQNNRTMDSEQVQTGIFTCYTSRASECDSSPTITASSERVRNGITANNCLEFGKNIRIVSREYKRRYEGRHRTILEIQDRMNSRYNDCCNCFDIYWGGEEAVESCLEFGRQEMEYIIIN